MIIGCDGIFDRLNNCDVVHSIWSMCNENYLGKDVNEHCGKIADIIIRNCLASNANDNLTCIFVCFENFKNLLYDNKNNNNNNNNIINNGNPNVNMIMANLRNITCESFSELIPDSNLHFNDERERSNTKNPNEITNNNNINNNNFNNNSTYITPGKSGQSKTESKNHNNNHNHNNNNNTNHNHNNNHINNHGISNNIHNNNNHNMNNHNITNTNNINNNQNQNNNNINYALSNSKEQKKDKKFQMTLSQHNNFEPNATKLTSPGKPKVLSPLNAKSINKYFSPTNTSLKNFNSTLINSGMSNQLLSYSGNNNINSMEEHMQTKSKFNKSTVVNNNKLDLISPKNTDMNKKMNIRNIHDDKFKSLPAINLNFSLKNKN